MGNLRRCPCPMSVWPCIKVFSCRQAVCGIMDWVMFTWVRQKMGPACHGLSFLQVYRSWLSPECFQLLAATPVWLHEPSFHAVGSPSGSHSYGALDPPQELCYPHSLYMHVPNRSSEFHLDNTVASWHTCLSPHSSKALCISHSKYKL